MDKQNIVVAGLGYVGLSLSCLLAQHHHVTGVDVVEAKVRLINAGASPIRDAEIESFLASGTLDLTATTEGADAYAGADWVVVSTPTNYDDERHFFDTSAVESVLDQLVAMNSEANVVIKSTIPVGYTEGIAERYPSLKLLFSPEFLREGHALYDNLHPSRIVVGVPFHNEDLMGAAHAFAELLAQGADDKDVEQLIVGSTEAEAIKLFSNTYLALRVSYFNELDSYAESRGLNSAEIIRGVGLDPRIGSHYNLPSFGYGGYCLPKDSKQLLANFEGVPQNLIRAIVASNATRKDFITAQIVERDPKLVGVYRLAMKRGSDNYRQSAILGVMERLTERGIPLLLWEPSFEGERIAGAEVIRDLDEFKRRCDLIVCNRLDPELEDVADKVYTRDLEPAMRALGAREVGE